MKTKLKSSQTTGGESVDSNRRNKANNIESQANKTNISKNKAFAKRSGELGTSSFRSRSPFIKSEVQSALKTKTPNIKKSPQISVSKKVAISKKNFKEKNAPKIFHKVGVDKLFHRGRQKLNRKEIEILIETPKIKKEESKQSSVAASSVTKRGESLAEPMSKSKERIRNLSKKTGEEDEFLKNVNSTNLPKKEIAKRTGRVIEKEETIKKPRVPTKSDKEKSVSGTRKLERSRNKDEKSTPRKNLAKRSFPIIKEKVIKNEEESPQKNVEQKGSKVHVNNIPKNPIRKAVIKPVERPKVEVKEEESDESKLLDDSLIKKDYSTNLSKDRKLVKKPIKHQIGYNVNTKAISEEITKILKKIEDKKKKHSVETELPIKTKLVKKLSAHDYGYKLKINPNFKPKHFINIEETNTKSEVTNSDVLLTIIEIAVNSDYYSISYNNRSRFFWEDVVKYEDLKNIYGEYKGETLRKYWKVISSIDDVNKISDLVKKHKNLFDEIKMKLLPIIVTIKKYLEGQIEDIESYIRNQTKEVRKTDLFEEVVVDPVTGLKKEISYKITTTHNIKKYESKITHEYSGKNFEGPVEDVIFRSVAIPTNTFQKTMKNVDDEDESKFDFLHIITEEDKKKILSFNNEEKLMVKIIDKIIDGLCAEFPNYNRQYVENILRASSMNIAVAYDSLKVISADRKELFFSVDDAIILTMKGKREYEQLLTTKGNELVHEREDFLLG